MFFKAPNQHWLWNKYDKNEIKPILKCSTNFIIRPLFFKEISQLSYSDKLAIKLLILNDNFSIHSIWRFFI